MKLQQSRALRDIYNREEEFSSALSNHIGALEVGSFEDTETESHVGTRKADIVAEGDDGVLVIENQLGRADWDHWGRLEAYARLKHAHVAVLVAESFEELMIVTCNLRNEDSKISWYLIQSHVNSHDELSFHHIARPAIDIQTENIGGEYSEFWGPVRLDGLFAGKPVPVRDEAWIGKGIRGITLNLRLQKNACSILLSFKGKDRIDRRAKVMELFPQPEYKWNLQASAKFANVVFPVLDKGKDDEEDWPEIRLHLTTLGEDIYNKIKHSGL